MKINIISVVLVLVLACSSNAKLKITNYSPTSIWIIAVRTSNSLSPIIALIDAGKTFSSAENNIKLVNVIVNNNRLSNEEFEATIAANVDISAIQGALRIPSFFNKFSADVLNDLAVYSFDQDNQGNYYFYNGTFPIDIPFEILLTSDLHTNPNTIQTEANEIHKRSSMIQFLNDPSKNVQGIVLAGDNAGGYGKASETTAFINFWFGPLYLQTIKKDANIYVTIGNHDTYWNAEYNGSILNHFISEPYPTKMMRFLEDSYQNLLYSFDIGMVHFINLGLHPSLDKVHGVSTSIPKLTQSLSYLANELNHRSKNQPIIIIFHYPTQGSMSDWWSKAEKDLFYEMIKDYNIIAILGGHVHSSTRFAFRNRIPSIRAASSNFAELCFDPKNPTAITVYFVRNDGTRYLAPLDPTQTELDLNPDHA